MTKIVQDIHEDLHGSLGVVCLRYILMVLDKSNLCKHFVSRTLTFLIREAFDQVAQVVLGLLVPEPFFAIAAAFPIEYFQGPWSQLEICIVSEFVDSGPREPLQTTKKRNIPS